MIRMSRRAAVGIVLALVLGLAGVVDADPIADFLARHWRSPLAPQGAPPAHYTPLEASLEPEACGTCHPVQYADWRTSVHAASMGPGIAGQLVEMIRSDPLAATSCPACHAPLAEQASHLREGDEVRPNPAFDATLRPRGVPCAGCHVRGHRRFGPPRRDGSLDSPPAAERQPHDGVTRTPAFLRAEFCRGCHQFEADGFALNGKLLEDTYAEWRASRFARDGVQCQECHMPDRRHLWRGIHDPEMVRRGVTVDAVAGAPAYRVGETAEVVLRVTNTGVGHAFPTYVTPLVVLRVELLDERGHVVEGSREERRIGREVALDLSRELTDTRLRPGERTELRHAWPVSAAGLRARASVLVYPDAFYTAFFETLLRQGAGAGEAQIREALAATRRSPFVLFERELSLS
jgi:cytochrome c554/c'-like protein